MASINWEAAIHALGVGDRTITAADPLPGNLRDALDRIHHHTSRDLNMTVDIRYPKAYRESRAIN